jgi:hypothetical protein
LDRQGLANEASGLVPQFTGRHPKRDRLPRTRRL